MSHLIYGLFDPRSEGAEIRYVGYTSYTAEFRLAQHIVEAKRGKMSHKNNWVRSLLARGYRPEVKVLELVTLENWQDRERHWISQFAKLTNGTSGGDGLIDPSPDVRDRISKSLKSSGCSLGNTYRLGTVHSEATRLKISKGLLNSNKMKAATLVKRSKSAQLTKAATTAAALVTKGVPKSPEHRAKIGAKNSGFPKVQGYKWINNNIVESLVPKDSKLPDGFMYGRLSRSN